VDLTAVGPRHYQQRETTTVTVGPESVNILGGQVCRRKRVSRRTVREEWRRDMA